MPTNRKLRGDLVNHDSPNWGPLEALVGRDLARFFTWKFEVELRKDRTRIHAYKHHSTRAYLYLTRDGRCFTAEPPESYRQTYQYLALMNAFGVWRGEDRPLDLYTPREQAILEFLREHASFDEFATGDETVLLAGPGRFAPLYRQPRWGYGDDDHWSDDGAELDGFSNRGYGLDEPGEPF